MDVLLKLKVLLDTDVALMDDEEYSKLVEEIGTSNKSQKEFIDYVLSYESLNVEDEYKIFMLLREIYMLAKYQENYNVNNLKILYKWVLKVMFKKEFYDYSMCYKFSDLLVKISNNIKQVFQDIIEKIDVYNSISVQIAICSMYGYYNFFEYKELTEKFLNKILIAIEKNGDNQGIIDDFNYFVMERINIGEYKQLENISKPENLNSNK
ncbi:hypothetical protein [Sebaldella sp. S0638]|uniref:hypothetical protein n=1 Tax=Sebaldella sp. S0638 TaxID=2957809 RepID=UPI0020A1D2C9|nr:hypothetical protein [Sebaldella sp. S0638]